MKRKKVTTAILNNVYLASPCSMSWDAMTGDERKRACSGCGKNVFNLSDMTKSEAEKFLVDNGTSQCAIFFRRDDGSIMTDDCPRALRKIRNQCRLVVKVAVGLIAFLVALPAQAQKSESNNKNSKDTTSSTKLFEVKPQLIHVEPTPRVALPGGMMIKMPDETKNVTPPVNERPKVTKVVRARVKTVTNTTPDGKKFTEVKADENGNVIRIINLPDKKIPRSTTDARVGDLPVEQTLTELQADDAHRLMDTRASNFYASGKQALKDQKYDMAEFYFEKALECFDSQKNGDNSYRQLIESDLKNIKSLQQTAK
ncbi:MAG: hypothetical protein K2X93_17850 [Candidatus Obscuribacterales bacterium]|nr:hypothetical protein [Candidatus Obscuribacterales bacterium]